MPGMSFAIHITVKKTSFISVTTLKVVLLMIQDNGKRWSMSASGLIHRVLGYVVVLSTVIALGVVSIPATAQPSGDDPQDAIVVCLVSGRVMTAKIDARTDTEQLWLRWESTGAEVLRPIQWEFVSTAEIKGNKISGNDFLELVCQIRREVPAQLAANPPMKNIVMLGPSSVDTSKLNTVSNQLKTVKPPPVEWLKVEAGPARWDNYSETDGMRICISPIDAHGEVAAVCGTLDVDLIAEQSGAVRLPNPFNRIGHWSQSVKPADFGPYGAVYRLPFQDVNPEFSRQLRAQGAIHATLSIPGQGTFEATDDARIRPYSLIRDRLQQTTGERFFPVETIGRPWERK
jgi:hypothetical protein